MLVKYCAANWRADMKNELEVELPITANDIREGSGAPVILIHGLAASLHDWDDLIPELTKNGYAAYALDLLGHGDSPKPKTRAYRIQWLSEHFFAWMESLHLTEPAILVGHSLGGYIALEFARRFPERTRGLILVNPFYTRSQLPYLLRATYASSNLRDFIIGHTPEWMFRMIVDATSVVMGNSNGSRHALPERVRLQTAIDYTRTAPGIYYIPNDIADATDALPQIVAPTLVVWGDRDQTLAPTSFPPLVDALPHAAGRTIKAGHVPHQSNAEEFNRVVLEFLKRLEDPSLPHRG